MLLSLLPTYRRLSIGLFLATIAASAMAQSPNLAERLGYQRNAILLIVHADDLGLSHSENAASFSALENGSVSSASIMMPTPWVTEVARYAQAHPHADLGLHLTLTSEWETYRWGPVSPIDKVPSLVGPDHTFPDTTQQIANNANPQEVERELRAQIEKAIAMGIDFTHLDAHMGAPSATPELASVYLKLAHEYRVPALLSPTVKSDPILSKKLSPTDIIPESIHGVPTDAYPDGMAEHYANTLKELGPGLNIIIIHAAFDTDEMRSITVNREFWGARWRQIDYDFFTSDACAAIIADRDIQLVTWRAIRDEIVRK